MFLTAQLVQRGEIMFVWEKKSLGKALKIRTGRVSGTQVFFYQELLCFNWGFGCCIQAILVFHALKMFHNIDVRAIDTNNNLMKVA